MGKFLPSILPIVTLLATAFSAPMQAYVSHHPVVALTVATISAVLNHLLDSPVAPAKS